MQKTLCAVAAALCLISAGSAYATPTESYNLTLTPGSGPAGDKSYQGNGGSGTLTITASGTPNGTYSYDYGFWGSLTELSFTVNDDIGGTDPLVFDLDNNNTFPDPSVTFANGTLTGITYQSTDISGNFLLNFDTSDMAYKLTDQRIVGGTDPVVDQGTIGLTPTSAAPEPSSLLLLGTGLMGVCGVVRRRIAA